MSHPKLKVFQNKFFRACLFYPRHCPTTLLYSTFAVLKLKDMINMEHSKFMFKIGNHHLLPNFFNNCFTNLKTIQYYNTRQKNRKEFFQKYVNNEQGEKTLYHICINVWKNVQIDIRYGNFKTFSKNFKTEMLVKYAV